MIVPNIIVGHLAPDLDCIAAIWVWMRFGGADAAQLQFVAAGTTLDGTAPDTNPRIVHVDTGGGRFDHHAVDETSGCAAELVRRVVAPADAVLQRIVEQVDRNDHANLRRGERSLFFSVNDLIAGYNLVFPDQPDQVVRAMLPNLDAWYAQEQRHTRLEQAFTRRIEFQTRWGKGIAMESEDGGSSRLAYREGAVLYAYRDGNGFSGVAAQSHSAVDLSRVYANLQRIDAGADWYLHPNKRLLLCGTPKSPVRHLSELSLEALVEVLKK